MKSTIIIGLTASAQAHTIFQKLSINGIDQGQLTALRAPSSDYPVYDVTDPHLACGLQPGSHSPTVLPIRAGDTIGAGWGHVLGGAQIPNDPDNPISPSHKGPISTYMARVEDAATADSNDPGLRWFKIAEDGLDTATGTWGVDRMIAQGGWAYARVPECLEAGEYLVRQELLALHSAYDRMGAQFYQSCAQVNVTSSGSYLPSGEETVSIPGAYGQEDPGVLIQIWVNGVPDNGRKTYVVPGPRPISC